MGIGDSGGWGVQQPFFRVTPKKRLVEIVLDGSADRVLIPTDEVGKYGVWEKINLTGQNTPLSTTRIGSYEIPGTYRFVCYQRR